MDIALEYEIVKCLKQILNNTVGCLLFGLGSCLIPFRLQPRKL